MVNILFWEKMVKKLVVLSLNTSFEAVCCGPVEKNTEHSTYCRLIVVVWLSSKALFFSNIQIEIFDDFRQFSTKSPILQKNLQGRVSSHLYEYQTNVNAKFATPIKTVDFEGVMNATLRAN